MKKVIKLKQSDLENIVSNVINEIEGSEVDATTEPTDVDNSSEEENNSSGGFAVGVDRNGKHYLINVETGEVIAEK